MKTSSILLSGFLSLIFGFVLIIEFESTSGIFFILFLAPCLFLYPIIRFLFFGGKDSVAAVVTTVVTEEVIKATVKNKIEQHKKRSQKK